ncbi:MAG: hypothetical protein IJ198_06125 [Lachnospiraceae bacterium]|nr:hypothetical protein [Lachnospiraceae bacterium]
MNHKAVMIAMGSRNETLAGELTKDYEARGYQVIRSEERTQEGVKNAYEKVEKDGIAVETCILFPEPVYQVSLFDDDFIERMEASIDEGLIVGAWWLQQTANYLNRNGIKGQMIVMNHVSNIVPTQRYSYCSIPEAALANLVRVGVMDTHGNTDININLLTLGWLESTPMEKKWEEEMVRLYGGAKAPVLKCVADQEVIDACRAFDLLGGMNGGNIVLDNGFAISRTIRQLENA